MFVVDISVHDYNYKRDSWNASAYVVPRFASEFGVQSWCSTETLAAVSLPAVDWNLNSSFVSHRQHHPHGQYWWSVLVHMVSASGQY